MRFVDANVFIYAYYKPKRQLSPKEKQMKEHAKKIISDISQGNEQVAITVVHLSEIVNILKHEMRKDQLNLFIRGLFMLDNLRIDGVTRDAYFDAAELGDDLTLKANDAFAIDLMRQNNMKEIYTFDEDLDQTEGTTRLPKQ